MIPPTMNTTHHPSITKRPANERGSTNLGWLQSRHTFSFGAYHDPAHSGHRALRVINDDVVAPNSGFGSHPHSDMEILSYVISGSLEHRDSLGNGRVIHSGEFQFMSAGRGVTHSEFNPSPDTPVHFLQIWITPSQPGGDPRYQDFNPGTNAQPNSLTLLASPDGARRSAPIRQNASVHFARLDPSGSLDVPANPETPHAWLHVIQGHVSTLNCQLSPGDGAAIHSTAPFPVTASHTAEFLVFLLT